VVLIGKPTYYCFYKPGSTCKAATPSTAAEVLIWAFPLPFYALLIIGLVAKAQIHMGFTDLENEADSITPCFAAAPCIREQRPPCVV
jgi:hypothetical protein